MVTLENRLRDLLGVNVDLSPANTLKEPVRRRAGREAMLLPFDKPVSALRDIADAVVSIQQFTEGMDFEAFRQDLKTIAAVERKLPVISEAAIRLAAKKWVAAANNLGDFGTREFLICHTVEQLPARLGSVQTLLS